MQILRSMFKPAKKKKKKVDQTEDRTIEIMHLENTEEKNK